jgi:hypothetical protein
MSSGKKTSSSPIDPSNPRSIPGYHRAGTDMAPVTEDSEEAFSTSSRSGHSTGTVRRLGDVDIVPSITLASGKARVRNAN